MKKLSIIFIAILFTTSIFSQKNNNLFPVYKDIDNLFHFKYGYIDNYGKLIINYIYDYADFFYNGLAIVKSKYNFGFINSDGIVVIDIIYDKVGRFSENLAYFEKGDKKGYLKSNGSIAFYLPNVVINAYSFSENIAIVSTENGECGIIDTTGKFIYPLQKKIYIYGLCKNGLIPALNSKMPEKQSGFIDKYGNIKINFKYKRVGVFSENLAPVLIDSLVGFIDTNGVFIIKPTYIEGESSLFLGEYKFTDGICRVAFKNGNFGYINKQGSILFTNKIFNSVDSFYEGKALIIDKFNFARIINKDGAYITNILISLDKNQFFYRKLNLALCASNGENVYININTGKVIWKGKAMLMKY